MTIAGDMKEGFAYVGNPAILRVTMKSSDTMQGVGVGLISFAGIFGTLTIGLFAKKIKRNTLHRWIAGRAM